MRRQDHNKCVSPHLFSGPWMVGTLYRVGELVQMHTTACVTRHFLLASKMKIASIRTSEAISPLVIRVWLANDLQTTHKRRSSETCNMSCTR